LKNNATKEINQHQLNEYYLEHLKKKYPHAVKTMVKMKERLMLRKQCLFTTFMSSNRW